MVPAEAGARDLALRPGTDGALACAVMHVAFRDGHADRDFLARLSDFPPDLEAHLAVRGPEWEAAVTGLPVAEIAAFAALYCRTKRAYLRLGYGFTRGHNGAAIMHAVPCLPTVTRSTSSRTIRTCAAGDSTPHNGPRWAEHPGWAELPEPPRPALVPPRRCSGMRNLRPAPL